MAEQPVEPTEQEWRALYEAAARYKKLAPWDWMLDRHIFGVRDPESDVVGYCCVMGNAGEHFALGVYLGDEGLRGYTRIQSGEFFDNPDESLFAQHCLMASFEDRELIDKRDYAQIKALGLRFRGAAAWPQFRNYTPGYYPWYIDGAEARFLTVALDQSCDVATRFAENPRLLTPRRDGSLLVRVREGEGWRDALHTPNRNPAPAPSAPPPPVDELRIQRLKGAQLARSGIWETGHFYFPQPTQDEPGERPYFAKTLMFVDGRSGMILAPRLVRPEEWRPAYQEQLLELIEQARAIPSELAVRDEETRDLLAPAAQPLGIRLRVAKQLPALDMAQDSLAGFMGGM